MKPNGRRRWRKWAKKNGAGRGDFADYRRFRRHGDSTYDGVVGMQPGPCPRRSFTPRSLVGMTMGARKRAARFDAWHKAVTYGREVITRALRRCIATDRTKLRVGNVAIEYTQQRRRYRIGERLRPCPNPFCSKEDGCALRQCHGSGVLPARSRVNRGKPLAVEPADDLG